MTKEEILAKFEDIFSTPELDMLAEALDEYAKAHTELMIGSDCEATDSDDGYTTGVTKNGERLTHNQRIGYNRAKQEIRERNNEV